MTKWTKWGNCFIEKGATGGTRFKSRTCTKNCNVDPWYPQPEYLRIEECIGVLYKYN